MIQRTAPILQGYDWKNQLARAIRDPAELLHLLELPSSLLPLAKSAAKTFPLRVPHSYLQRINKGDPDDPLLRQILPLGEELNAVEDFHDDPVGDLAAQKSPGLLHKYQGRALLITTGACGIHCRYCFRRNYPYGDSNPMQDNRSLILNYLRHDAEIHEIILSGGDPLSLSDQRLASLVADLESVPHLATLRIHTRLPVVVPQRVTEELLHGITTSRFKTVMVLHINHANEIDSEVISAMVHLKKAGITLLNQAVLLKGVNDSVEALKKLSHALFNAHILPYYLHQLDQVNGAAHFAVTDTRAMELLAALRQQLPGYLLPRLVREHAGASSKLPLL
ncbi:MAG: EF-P beta-lysylation protein EpmB [Gammaproteobacteria bacterium SG8_15]|nr:MAG: EF-P beta-lysylation protein EpmB [Gammaproteobacteria bacterium SG8_15]